MHSEVIFLHYLYKVFEKTKATKTEQQKQLNDYKQFKKMCKMKFNTQPHIKSYKTQVNQQQSTRKSKYFV